MRETLGEDYVGNQSLALPDYKAAPNVDETGFNGPVYDVSNCLYDQEWKTNGEIIMNIHVEETDTMNSINTKRQIEESGKPKWRNKLSQENRMKTTNDDIYANSEEGTYDVSNNLRHKDVDSNLYGHAVDHVYDTSSHIRKTEYNETYDHFDGN